MKKIILPLAVVLLRFTSTAWACDSVLKSSRDCQIQDRFRQIRSEFKIGFNIDINDVAEYRAIRFIDRESWERAKVLKNPPNSIYDPAPMTWNVWSHGIDSLFPAKLNINNLNEATFSKMNTVLLTDGSASIKDDKTDENMSPGEYRGESQIGFCSHASLDHRQANEKSVQSMLAVQARFEGKLKISLNQLIQKEHGIDSGLATLGVGLRSIVPGCGADGQGIHTSYVRSELVRGNMDWIRIFLKSNLSLIKSNNSILTPIELSAFVQKWLVTVHPFADGNGRTSRALQDLVLESFDLPFAPSGDLQNDALEEFAKYADNTYVKTEEMVSKLESCLKQYKTGAEISYECKTVSAL